MQDIEALETPSEAKIGLDDSAQAERWTILSPGRNCWQIGTARRAAILIDGAAYFEQLEGALRAAQRSILILGWDFDGRILLRPDREGPAAARLGPLLRSLVEERPALEVRILVWSAAVAAGPSDAAGLLFEDNWQDHSRICLRLDTHHPFYATHHQKLVCIDDALAFAGGIDLTVWRWDTSAHLPENPLRCSPDGEPSRPVHDVQVAVDGDVACCLADLARLRWQNAVGERLAPVDGNSDPWPDNLKPDLCDLPIGIARTSPALGRFPQIQEAITLTLDALKAARRLIYIEAQYFAAPWVGDVLARRLQEPDGPEIVVITTNRLWGLVERLAMGANRDRLIRRLKRVDRFDRLRVYYPLIADDGQECEIMVHSKLIVVDDVFVRIGSSNLNNRSAGLDTECDLGIEARDGQTRDGIGRIGARLLSEHLGVAADRMMAACAEGSVIGAIGRFNTGTRRLCPFPAMNGDGPTRPVLGSCILDPKRPFEPLWWLRRKPRVRLYPGSRSRRRARVRPR